MKNLLEAHRQAATAGQKTALATVVHVEGSAYRKAGARMLIVEDGTLHGAISGGCLEGDALRKALHVMATGQPRLVRYDSTDEEEAHVGWQLGCRGIIHVLIEPVFPVEIFEKLLARRQNAVLATLFSLENARAEQPGTQFLFLENDRAAATDSPILSAARQVFLEKKSVVRELSFEGKFCSALLEFAAPPPRLVIFGAGNDVVPLVQMAEILGWETVVADGRPQLARAERFPTASCVLAARPDEISRFLPADARTFFLLMTHNYQYDLAALRVLLPADLRYIGLLGARSKFGRMLDELRAEGLDFQEDTLPQVFAPVGLNIGTDAPETIALGIVAEIQALLSGILQPNFLSRKG